MALALAPAQRKIMQKTQLLRIRGRVQGVGYREAMRAAAVRLGCAGWVRNRSDGSVEAIVQGEADAVDALLAWARRGPPAARVDSIDSVDSVEAGEAQGEFQRFEIAPGI